MQKDSENLAKFPVVYDFEGHFVTTLQTIKMSTYMHQGFQTAITVCAPPFLFDYP